MKNLESGKSVNARFGKNSKRNFFSSTEQRTRLTSNGNNFSAMESNIEEG